MSKSWKSVHVQIWHAHFMNGVFQRTAIIVASDPSISVSLVCNGGSSSGCCRIVCGRRNFRYRCTKSDASQAYVCIDLR